MPRQSTSQASKAREASRLSQLRNQLGLTQLELAKDFNVSRNALAMWERGERTIPGPVLKLIEIYEKRLSKKGPARSE